MRLGQVALKRRRFDGADWQRGKNLPVRPKWVAIDGECGPSVLFNFPSERFDGRRRLRAREASRIEAA